MKSDMNYVLPAIAREFEALKVRVRLNINNIGVSEWGGPLFFPAPGYVEIKGLGPVKMSDVEWVEIDPNVTEKKVGYFRPQR